MVNVAGMNAHFVEYKILLIILGTIKATLQFSHTVLLRPPIYFKVQPGSPKVG
jgi:hypothetical protein